mgnify:CR=1
MENSNGGAFAFGFLTGAILMVTFTIIFFINEPTTINTYEKLTPKTKLTTNGVKVDTLYIYTSK